ncbi:tetratricopeptide repeat protein [Massilia sp. YIM B02443]|uniref:tetratricopeptide repeat protein n=1 Tax=Massilia sp. YIM B02443 TaxID=3050127 RepID=UPI0025B6D4E7|nr:tetratricopeptide repeat protein [Massilia sp. YIM B02443]MDN4039095.1 tetratricopeptide repeat protein [Massilia sp. YIM B02443]
MSLINKMLQDLDARAGKPGAAPLPGDVRPVLAGGERAPWGRPVTFGAVAVVLVGVGTWLALERRPAPAAPQPVTVVAAPVAAPPVELVSVAPVQEAPQPAPEPAEPLTPEPPAPGPEPEAPAPKPAPRAERAKPAVAAKPLVRKAEPVAKPVPARAPVSGRTETPAQRADNAYKRALGALEDGRVTEAIATLQAGLRANPKHEAARQTLVSLLIEAKRPDEAMRQLQAALTPDPRQPSLAMLLARLQLERGGPALETLNRTLPHAAGNGEYHAFLAGVLQREGRPREAAEHYRQALRTAPQNGVWWMGLGISLQGEKRDGEAVEAFQRARDSGTLSAELQGFVERRLKQLGR